MLDSRPLQGYLFGIPLETILRREKAPIPKFFTDCVEWLRKHGNLHLFLFIFRIYKIN